MRQSFPNGCPSDVKMSSTIVFVCFGGHLGFEQEVFLKVVEGEDFIEITPPLTFNDVAIDTYDDHRIAMCFAMVAVGGKPITINDPKCTYKTFPTFFNVLASVSE